MDTLLTVRLTAKRLGITDRAVRERISKRQIPFIRMGRSLRVSSLELERFLDTLPGCDVEEAVEKQWAAKE